MPGKVSHKWFRAAKRGTVGDILKRLAKGADVNAVDECNMTALYIAVRYRHLELVRILLDHGADPNIKYGQGWTTTTEVASQHSYRDHDDRAISNQIWEMLKAAGGQFGWREAVLMGDVELARELFKSNPSFNVSDNADVSYYDTYLMVAAECGYFEMTQFLLDCGADIEGTDDLGVTALMRASRAGKRDIVTLLLDRGAIIDHDDWSDQTPLSKAAVAGHRDIVDLLISRGAERGLLDAVALNDVGLVEKILSGDSDLDEVYFRQGDWIARVAVIRGNEDVLRLLRKHEAAHYDPCHRSNPLLVEAAIKGRLEVVKLLIEQGADLNQAGPDGLRALSGAAREGHMSIVEYLKNCPSNVSTAAIDQSK